VKQDILPEYVGPANPIPTYFEGTVDNQPIKSFRQDIKSSRFNKGQAPDIKGDVTPEGPQFF